MIAMIISGSVCVAILLLLGKAANDLVYHLAHRYQRYSGFAWRVAHATWERYWIGGLVAAIPAWACTYGFCQVIRVEQDYTEATRPTVQAEADPFEFQYTPIEPSTNRPACKPAPVTKEKAQEVPGYRFNPDTDIVAYTIWYEGRGEPPHARSAIASVIWNRAGGDPSKLKDVVSDPSWLGHNQVIVPQDLDYTDTIARECLILAQDMTDGTFCPTGKWTHFYNPALADPGWKWRLASKKRIGQQIFGRIHGAY